MAPAHENENEHERLIAPYAWSMPGWPSERQSSDEKALEVWGYAERFSYAPGEVLNCMSAARSRHTRSRSRETVSSRSRSIARTALPVAATRRRTMPMRKGAAGRSVSRFRSATAGAPASI